MEMQIDLTQLETGNVQFVEAFGPGELSVRDVGERFEPLRAELVVSLHREKGGVRATGDFSGAVRAECDRCLKPLEVDVASHFDQRYVWSEDGAVLPVQGEAGDEDGVEIEVAELDVERLDAPVLDTRDLALEQLQLAEPIRVVCSEDCRGLCPTCGADLNASTCDCTETPIDPRWDALRDFKKQ